MPATLSRRAPGFARMLTITGAERYPVLPGQTVRKSEPEFAMRSLLGAPGRRDRFLKLCGLLAGAQGGVG